MKRKILWEFWNNPLDPENEWKSEDDPRRKQPVYSGGSEEDDEDDEEFTPVRPVLLTAVGMVPLKPYVKLDEAFEFWIGHANFDLCKAEGDAIEQATGVETLDVMTRYRFRISVGKGFDGPTVLRNIEKAVGVGRTVVVVENPFGLELPPDAIERVEAIKAATDQVNPSWALLVTPNGNVDVTRGRDRESVASRLELYRKVQLAVGGVIFHNGDSQSG